MSNIRVLGVDPGTANTGFSVIEARDRPNISAYGLIRTSPKDGSVRERIDYIGKELEKVIEEYQPNYIAIEDFTEQGKMTGKTYKDMAWITEHLRMLGRMHGFDVIIYKNGEWKKKTLGIMRATKQQVMHYVSRKVPETKELLQKMPDHVWDSVGIALCALQEIA